MTNSELLSIGAFAHATGLTPGALRFYADSSILAPATVDPSSGYRYYAADQIARAVTIRRLRGIGMSLGDIARVLAGDCDAVDLHVDGLADEARRARRVAAGLRTERADEKQRATITVNGPVFANAVDHVLTATAHHPEHPVLAGVYLEVEGNQLTVTATDRYRLSTRIIAVASAAQEEWDVLVDGDDLRAALPAARRQHRVQIMVDGSGIEFRPSDTRCRRLPESFPNYRAMLDALPSPRTRVVVSRRALVDAIERSGAEHVDLTASDTGLTVCGYSLPA